MLTAALFIVASLLAYANGANDNFKGVASLYASRTLGYRSALAWGTGATLLGSLASIVFAQGLLATFSGKGLVPPAIEGDAVFLLAVAAGAGGTVLLATRLGFPISTTHGLVGGIVGAGALAAGAGLNVAGLASVFLLPLVASPLIALILAAALYWSLHGARRSLGIRKDHCVCVSGAASGLQPAGLSGALAARSGSLQVAVGTTHECTAEYAGNLVGIEWQRVVDGAHVLSAGLVSFARGMNDTPKIAALLLAVHVLDIRAGLLVIGVAMAVGGLLGARRVARTLGDEITSMNHGQGLAANVATGLLVIWASRLGLPVSTTHVSVGALFGIGLTTGQANTAVVGNVVLSWVVTLPCAAALGAAVYWLVASGAG